MIDPNAFPIPPELCTLETCPLTQAQVAYTPSLPGNSLYIALFGLILLAQVCMGVKYRVWGFLAGMVFGLALEIVGYVARIQLHFNPFKFDPFTLQLICLTIAPAFLSASIYLCLARIITVYSAEISRVKPRTYTFVFVGCDFVSLLLQAIGGAIAATADTPDVADKGVNIMIAGLVFQVASLILFLILWGEFALRARAAPADKIEQRFSDVRSSFRFKAFCCSLWSAAILIFIRSIYRVIELHAGFGSEFANNEPAFMVFEGPMIILATGLLSIFHPGFAFGGKWEAANWSIRKGVLDSKA